MDAWSVNKQLPGRPIKDDQVTAFINRDLIPILKTLKSSCDCLSFVSAISAYSANTGEVVLFDASGGTFQITLPEANAGNRGSVVFVKSASTDTTAVTVAPPSGFIDGAASLSVYGNYAAVGLISNGAEWTALWRDPGKGNTLSSRLIWSPDDDDWRPGNVIPRTIPNWHSPVGLWQFSLGSTNGLKDQSGNGRDLTVEAGTGKYAWMHPGMLGYLFDGTNRLIRNTAESAFRFTGEMSALCVLVAQSFPAATQYLFSHGAAGETSDTNLLYSAAMNLAGTAAGSYVLSYNHEQGAGVNVTADLDVSWTSTYVMTMLGMSRTASGGNVTYVHYVQGSPWATSTAVAVTAPTDGSNGRFRIGGFDGSGYFVGMMSGFALYDRALTGTEHKDLFNYCLGPTFGMKL